MMSFLHQTIAWSTSSANTCQSSRFYYVFVFSVPQFTFCGTRAQYLTRYGLAAWYFQFHRWTKIPWTHVCCISKMNRKFPVWTSQLADRIMACVKAFGDVSVTSHKYSPKEMSCAATSAAIYLQLIIMINAKGKKIFSKIIIKWQSVMTL